MRTFETADVAEINALIEALKARHETLKAQFATESQDTQNAEEIAAERERADKASAELFRVADRLAAIAEERSRPWWRRVG